jgi:hypothetical protein
MYEDGAGTGANSLVNSNQCHSKGIFRKKDNEEGEEKRTEETTNKINEE